MEAPPIKVLPDDTGCEHMDGPDIISINKVLVWTCPLCHHLIGTRLGSNGNPTGSKWIVEIG